MDDGLGGDFDVAVAGEAADGGSGSCSGEAAYYEAYSAGGYTADKHAETGASADEGCGALAFALLGAGEVAGLKWVAGAVEGERGQAQLEDGRSFEVAAAVGDGDYSTYGGAFGDHELAVLGGDGLDYFAVEVISGAAGFDADVLVDTDGEVGAGGDVDVGGTDDDGAIRGRRGGSWLASGYGGLGGWGRGVGGADGLGGLAGGWGLDGGGCGVAGLVDGDNLLGLAGGGGLFFGGVDGLLVFGFAPGKEGECECYRCCVSKDS